MPKSLLKIANNAIGKLDKKESKNEKKLRQFAYDVFSVMQWGEMQIARFWLTNKLKTVRGYCTSTNDNRVMIAISRNSAVYPDGANEKDIWLCLVHELAHAHLYLMGHGIKKSFSHGKAFKKVCREIEKATNGEYSFRELMGD